MYVAVREPLTELKPWMSWAYDRYSMEETEHFIQITRARWEEQTLFAFIITDAKARDLLGGISLSHIHPVYRHCNVSY